MYEVINANNCLNLRTNEYEPTCRTRTSPGAEGNCAQWVLGSEKMGLTLVNQAAGMGTITSYSNDGFVYHSNSVEIEYLTDSVCDLHYPDGTHVEMVAGDALCHQPGMPHGMLVTAPRNMEVAVILSCAPNVCNRFEFVPGKDEHACDKWQVKRCSDLPAAQCDNPGVIIKEVFENNEQPVCFAEVTLKPGAVIPLHGFAANVNCDEMVLVVKGKGLAVYPDQTYPLSKHIALYNYAGQPYQYINTGDEDMVLLCTWSLRSFAEIERTSVVLK